MGRLRVVRSPWAFWLTVALMGAYCVAIAMGTPFVRAAPIVCVALMIETFCAVPEEFVTMRNRRYAVAGSVVLAGLVLVITGGNMSAGLGTLTVALSVVPYMAMALAIKDRCLSLRKRGEGTCA